MDTFLELALNELENLEAYYKSQKKAITKNIKSKVGKYIYGVVLDRFFANKVFGSEAISITKTEEKMAESLLESYKIMDDGKTIKYKLKENAVDKGKNELDPFIAKKEYIKLTQQPSILNESVLIMLMIKFEKAISDIYSYLVARYPEAYLSDKCITFSELISINADVADIKDHFIKREVEEFMRRPISEWYSTFEEKHKAKFYFDNDELAQFKELYYARNLVVHNQGEVNEIYLKNVKKSQYNVGDFIEISEDYLSKAFILTKKIVIGTFFGMRKACEHSEEINTNLFIYGYNCMRENDWNLANYIFTILCKEKSGSYESDLVNRVNCWITIKHLKGIDAISAEVSELDISAMNMKYSIAKYALLNEFDKVSESLEIALERDIMIQDVKEWPLFIEYRNSSQYTKFVKKHAKAFSSEGYITDNEAIDNTEEVIAEIEEKAKNEK